MVNKTLKTRIVNKHDTTANWNTRSTFIPKAGEVIIYTDTHKVKVGDGTTTVSALPFIDSKIVYLGTLFNSGTLDADKFQEIAILFDNSEIKQVLFIYNGIIYITANIYSDGVTSMDIVAYDVSNSLNAVNLSINPEDGNYTITTISLPSSYKTINGNDITGSGNIAVQATLISGSNIKTINEQSLVGSGNISVQEKLVSGTNIKTINNQSILAEGNINTGLPAQQYTISSLDFNNFSVGQSVNISASDNAIIENAITNKASVIYNENLYQYLPLLYVEVGDDIQVLYNDLFGNCGVVSINTYNNTATVLSVFNTESKSTINLNTISNTKTNYDNVFNYLVEQGFARAYFNVEGYLDQANSIGNEQYYEAYLSGENKYFASCGKIYQYIVDTSTQGFHVELVSDASSIINATDNEVNNLFTNPGQPIPKKSITLENLNAFKQQITNEINNEIGQVLVEGF